MQIIFLIICHQTSYNDLLSMCLNACIFQTGSLLSTLGNYLTQPSTQNKVNAELRLLSSIKAQFRVGDFSLSERYSSEYQ